MQNQERADISVKRVIDAPVDAIYDAWLDPKKAGKFLFATASGQMVRAETDPRVGGGFTFVDRRDGQDFEHVGTYVELIRPKRIVFDFWLPKFSPEKTRVEVDIAANGPSSDVTLTHRKINKEYEEKTIAGWSTILKALGDSLT